MTSTKARRGIVANRDLDEYAAITSPNIDDGFALDLDVLQISLPS